MNVSLVNKANRIGYVNFVTLNGHIVAYGLNDDNYQAKCVSCEETHTLSDRAIELSNEQYLFLKLYALHGFLDDYCEEPRDSVQKVVSDKVISNYIGDIKTDDKIIQMQHEVQQLIGPYSNIDIDIDAV